MEKIDTAARLKKVFQPAFRWKLVEVHYNSVALAHYSTAPPKEWKLILITNELSSEPLNFRRTEINQVPDGMEMEFPQTD